MSNQSKNTVMSEYIGPMIQIEKSWQRQLCVVLANIKMKYSELRKGLQFYYGTGD